jgi:hypothetical protein
MMKETMGKRRRKKKKPSIKIKNVVAPYWANAELQIRDVL